MSDQEKHLRTIFIGWCVLCALLLIPWFLIAPVAGLIYDRGGGWKDHLFVLSVWTYPVIPACMAEVTRNDL